MSEHSNEIKQLAEEFEACQKILLALGDENRQHLILEMMKMDECVSVPLRKKPICPARRCLIIFRF